MCGIIAGISDEEIAPLLIEGLRRVEYRGYDSVGMATISDGRIKVRKGVGRLEDVEARVRMSDLAGTTGMAHCLHPSTYVQLADGRVTTIAEMKDVDHVLSLDPGTLTVIPAAARKFAHPSPGWLVKVRTGSSEIICTETHRMIVSKGGRIMECLAGELRPGDLLVRPKEVRVVGSPLRLQAVKARRYYMLGKHARDQLRSAVSKSGATRKDSAKQLGISLAYLEHLLAGDRTFSEDVLMKLASGLGIDLMTEATPVSHSHGKFVRLPTKSSPSLLQAVGYIMGDGSVRPTGIRIKDADAELIGSYKGLFDRLFAVEGRIQKHSDNGATVLDLNSVALRNWLLLNFLGQRKEFISSLGASNEEDIAGFIRGLFDAEGAVSIRARQSLLRMTDEQVVRTTQFLLLRLGVRSSVRSYSTNTNWSPVWELTISGENLLRFATVVGSSSRRKQRCLEIATRGIRSGKSSASFSVPLTKESLRRLVPTPGLNHFLQREEHLTDSAATILLQKAEVRSNEGRGLSTLLKPYLESDILFEKVREVARTPTDTDILYDLEVEGTCNFIANCLFTHNSRWATHGGVTKANAHPQVSCGNAVAVIHNGIIENYLELRENLTKRGHVFVSETDTEVIPHLIEEASAKGREPLKATLYAVRKLKGQYAIVVMFRDHPEVLTGARNDAPLIVGLGKGETFLASDVLAFISRTDKAVFLDNMEVVAIKADGCQVYRMDGTPVEKKPTQLAWELSDLSKLDYAHYTLKEIHEQPETVQRAAIQDQVRLESFVRVLKEAPSVVLTASGSSYHAALLLKDRLNRESKIRCDAILAGEFEDQAHLVEKGSVVLAFSQSGETADLLHAVKVARSRGAKVISVVNAAGSTLARESDEVLLLNCGPEVGVAATKSFTAQVTVGNVIADAVTGRNTTGNPRKIGELVESALVPEEKVRELARLFKDKPDFYFIARGHHYPVALEGALKLKELSYLHAEGMPASELKHGTLALIESGTPVVVIAPGGEGFNNTISNAMELQARGAEVIGISDKEHPVFKHRIPIPPSNESVAPILEVIPLQLLAYFMATERKNDPDYPRNLAKSVTVR